MLSYALHLIDTLFDCFSINHQVLILDPRFNARHTQDMPVVYRMSNYQLAEEMSWGFIPFWNKNRQIGERIATAKAETVMAIPIFKEAIMKRRCLIPATGFYEWARPDGRTQPYFIHLKNEPVFGFAGLYDSFTGKDGTERKLFTVLTTQANELIWPISERMPVIMQRRAENRWLDESLDPTALLSLLTAYPTSEMAMYPVSREVNNPRNDTEACLRPVVQM